MKYQEVIIKAIARHASNVTGHLSGCRCKRCAQERVRAKRFARLKGVLS
jgi:hypothetical protein